MIAFLFPGQGSQKVGMAKGLARDRFAEADAALGFALSKIIDEGPETELVKTAFTQPALLATSMAWADVLAKQGIAADLALGHSVGEFSALVYAGALSYADAIRLVHRRGKFMQEAVPVGVGKMAAIIGLQPEEVVACCKHASQPGDACQAANFNGAGQVVVAGHAKAVERCMALAKEKRAKLVKELPVSAPFHSALMAPAAERLAAELERITISPLKIPVVANITAEANRDHTRVKDLLVRQASGSVRWEESVLTSAKLGVTEVYEVGPGAVLAGLVKRIAPTLVIKPLPTLPTEHA